MSEQIPPQSRPSNLPMKIGGAVLVVIIFLAIVIYSRSNADVSNTNEVADLSNPAPPEETVNTNSDNPATPANNTNTKTSTVPATTTTPTAPVANTNTNANAPAPTSKYRNGTYSSTGSYNTPGGREEVGVSVTLTNGIITGSTVTELAKSPTSAQFQKEFIANYKQFVTGKSIESLKLSKVSGSSLTGAGFNAAIDNIQLEASL